MSLTLLIFSIFIIFLVNWFLTILSVTYKSASIDYLFCAVFYLKKEKHTQKAHPKINHKNPIKPNPSFAFCFSVLISFLFSRKFCDLKEDRIPCVMPLYMILLSNYSSYLEFRGDIGRAWKCPVFFALVVATLWHPQACTHTS